MNVAVLDQLAAQELDVFTGKPFGEEKEDQEEEEEFVQILEGGALNWMDMKLVMEGNINSASGLLQLQITSDYTLK